VRGSDSLAPAGFEPGAVLEVRAGVPNPLTNRPPGMSRPIRLPLVLAAGVVRYGGDIRKITGFWGIPWYQ
jgi:hypothetical protein